MANYRIARALDQMRSQVNLHAPGRNKSADGWIGDAKHAASTSDHNPWVKDGSIGIVTALDITHDPSSGVDTWKLADYLRTKRDARIKYVISNGRIFSSTVSAWAWRSYSGSNPHRSHIHVSVNSAKVYHDDVRPWDLGLSPGTPAPPVPDDRPASRPVLRRGSKGVDVRHLQSILLVGVDGDFGPITERVVRDFQGVARLAIDGIVGPKTWEALDKIEQIILPYESEPHLFSEPET